MIDRFVSLRPPPHAAAATRPPPHTAHTPAPRDRARPCSSVTTHWTPLVADRDMRPDDATSSGLVTHLDLRSDHGRRHDDVRSATGRSRSACGCISRGVNLCLFFVTRRRPLLVRVGMPALSTDDPSASGSRHPAAPHGSMEPPAANDARRQGRARAPLVPRRDGARRQLTRAALAFKFRCDCCLGARAQGESGHLYSRSAVHVVTVIAASSRSAKYPALCARASARTHGERAD